MLAWCCKGDTGLFAKLAYAPSGCLGELVTLLPARQAGCLQFCSWQCACSDLMMRDWSIVANRSSSFAFCKARRAFRSTYSCMWLSLIAYRQFQMCASDWSTILWKDFLHIVHLAVNNTTGFLEAVVNIITHVYSLWALYRNSQSLCQSLSDFCQFIIRPETIDWYTKQCSTPPLLRSLFSLCIWVIMYLLQLPDFLLPEQTFCFSLPLLTELGFCFPQIRQHRFIWILCSKTFSTLSGWTVELAKSHFWWHKLPFSSHRTEIWLRYQHWHTWLKINDMAIWS